MILPIWLISGTAQSTDSPRSQPVWAASSLHPHRWPNWHPPREPVLQPWWAGCGLSRLCRAELQDEGPWYPPGPTSPAQPPAQLHHSSPPTPHTLRTGRGDWVNFTLYITPKEPSVTHSSTGLTLCDAVHHWAKHQDVRAAICATSQPAVTAEACRTGRCQNMDTLDTAVSFWLIS